MLQLNGRLEFGLKEILSIRTGKEEVDVPKKEEQQLYNLHDIEDAFISEETGDMRTFNSARELLK